jgi:polyferredoxin
MTKVKKPEGLIRIDSKNNIEANEGFKFSPRIIAYSAVMLLLMVASVTILATRKSVEGNVLRIPGSTYSEAEDGRVTNMFNLSMVNKTFEDKVYRLELVESENSKNASLLMVQKDTILASNNEVKKVFMIYKEQKDIYKNEMPMQVNLFIDGELIKTSKFTFLAPVRR